MLNNLDVISSILTGPRQRRNFQIQPKLSPEDGPYCKPRTAPRRRAGLHRSTLLYPATAAVAVRQVTAAGTRAGGRIRGVDLELSAVTSARPRLRARPRRCTLPQTPRPRRAVRRPPARPRRLPLPMGDPGKSVCLRFRPNLLHDVLVTH